MRVDLFKSGTLRKDAPVRSGKVETRLFKLTRDVQDFSILDKYAVIYDEDAYKAYKEMLRREYAEGRKYTHLGKGACDNLAEHEKLGLALKDNENVFIIDFSNCLSLVLHEMTGCDPANIERLRNYAEMSYAILNDKQLEDSDFTFGDLAELDPKLKLYFEELYKTCIEKPSNIDTMDMLIYKFYSGILSELEDIKAYTFLEVQKILHRERISVIQRSKTYASVIGSIDKLYSGPIELVTSDGCSVTVEMRSYEPLKYLESKVFV